MTDPAPAALCSEMSAARGLPLVGSAGSYEQVLAFELDPPWTPRLVGSRASDSRLDAAIERVSKQAKHVRLLALEPRSGRAAVATVLHAAPTSPCRGYAKRDFEVARDALPELLETLALTGEAPGMPSSTADERRDLLVCTHGARDACCGKFGYRLYQDLVRLAAHGSGPPPRVWRCSHLGGHRFAPTLLDLPSGRMFGRVSTADAEAILAGGAALCSRLDAIYRGRCALPEPVQIAERDLWRETGAAFENASLRWRVSPQENGRWEIELEAEVDGAPPARSRAVVGLDEVEAVCTPASCGRDPESEAPWKVIA